MGESVVAEGEDIVHVDGGEVGEVRRVLWLAELGQPFRQFIRPEVDERFLEEVQLEGCALLHGEPAMLVAEFGGVFLVAGQQVEGGGEEVERDLPVGREEGRKAFPCDSFDGLFMDVLLEE